jgi:drug/metabolite transporter (DMT)-like permease
MPKWSDLVSLTLLTLSGHVAYNLLLGYGQTKIQSATASFLVSTSPLWIAVVGATLFREKLTISMISGLLLSLIGVGVIAIGRSGGLYVNSYAVLILIAAFFQATYSLGTRSILSRCTPLQVTSIVCFVSLTFLLPFSVSAFNNARTSGYDSIIAVVSLGIFPTVIGYWTWAYAVSILPTSLIGALLYLVPFVTMLLGWLILGEAPSVVSSFGGILILIGVGAVRYFSPEKQ